MPFPLEIWLVHPESEACGAFAGRFAMLPNVQVKRAVMQDLPPHDCFVTAGNAFGIMTAGVDAAVAWFHGQQLMDRIQHRIQDDFLGEQPVGTAFIEHTDKPDYPFICHAPTMRVPGSISGTDKVYAATWAAFVAVYRHNLLSDAKIRTVALPAMGTGFGGVTFDEAARQMAVAYEHYLHPPHRLDWEVVIDRQKAICYDGDRRVVPHGQ